MANLVDTVKEAVFWYAASHDNIKMFKLVDDVEQVYAVNILDTHNRQKNAGVVVIARVQGDLVIIEEDLTDRPLVDRLVAAGVPRDKIIMAYMGEPVPEPN
ncbi:MAG: XisI protein [Anaerolineae bacterium]|nr:MAG: XisI protein [Anaerolineae bacterium]